MTSFTENEFQEFESSNAWHGIFQRLKNEASLAMHDEDISTSCARLPDNRKRNRYRDVSPYNHSRILLQGKNDYINGSLVEVPEVNRRYILTQGPLEHTIGDFWQMTWEQKSRAVVMLNRVVEKGTLKCSQYWPRGSDHGHEDEMKLECGLKVTLTNEEDTGHFLLRTLTLEKLETQEKREVLHFHYTTWPDFGIPSSPISFLNFLHAVRQTGSLDSDVGPAIVHCSAGIGRSGTFCIVDSCLVQVKNNSTLECVNVRQSLIKMRYYRMGLIQTPDQLKFSYQAVILGANAILNGKSLGDLNLSNELNEMDGQMSPPPPPPERTSSLQAHPSAHNSGVEAPPLPPKKSQMVRDPSGLGPWADEDDSDDEDDEEFDELIDRKEDTESSEESDEDEDEEEIKAAEIRQQIREERKKETMEKIRVMKEKQKKSERYRKYQTYFGPKFYIGLAVLVGLAGVAVYKYLY